MKRSKNDLADFLRKKRREAGLSQGKVAHQLGCTTPQFISIWERGFSRPPIDILKKMGKLYNVPKEDLFEILLKTVIDEMTQEFKTKFWKSIT